MMSNKSVAINAAIADLWDEFKKLFKLIFTTYKEPPKHDYPVKLLTIEIDGGAVAFFRFQDQGWQANSKVNYFPANPEDAKTILKDVLGELQWLPFNNEMASEAAACEVSHHSEYQEFVKQILEHIPNELTDDKAYGGTFVHHACASGYPAELPAPCVQVTVVYGTNLFYTPVHTKHYSDAELTKIFPNVSLEQDGDASPPAKD